jgi:Ca-activated chloride channel family protein
MKATGYLDNFYARLGVPITATSAEVRAAYYEAARRLHPDTSDDPSATELFLQIQEAYETLSDPDKRKQYDKYLPRDISHPADILINAIYSRSVLPEIDRAQLVYVLIDFMAMPKDMGEIKKTPPLNISLVLDNSTSMNGDRMDMVKATASELINNLREEDIISVISYNDRAEVIIPATRAIDKIRLSSRINQLNTGGGTEIYQGLSAGVQEINYNLKPNQINHLILITDGRTYGDEDKCMGLASQVSPRGITISGLGIGHEYNDEFLDALTAKTGGNSYFASKPQNIRKLLEKQFNAISRTFANNMQLEYTTPENVDLRYAFRLIPDAGSLNTDAPVSLGNIPLERSLSIIMEFMVKDVPPGSGEVTLAEGQLKMTIPSRSVPNAQMPFKLVRQTAMDPEVEPPPQVLVKAMSRLSMYRMQEQARAELAAGNTSAATSRLSNLAAQLLSSGRPDLAHTVHLELDSIQNGKEVSAERQKQIKYGTRSLVMPEME